MAYAKKSSCGARNPGPKGPTWFCFINGLSTTAVVGFFSTLNFISERTNGPAHAVNIYFLFLGAKALGVACHGVAIGVA